MKYIIGDLHANNKELEKLLSVLSLDKGDQLIFLGDFLDKNINVEETLKLISILDEKYNCVFIKGNHDFVWDRYLNYGEVYRRDFLLSYGGIDTLSQFSSNPQDLLKSDDIETINEYLKSYRVLLSKMIDYVFVNDYIVLHAGIAVDQMMQEPLEFKEPNYFIRPKDMDFEKKYLNKYTLVAGHTHIDITPTIKKGYINIDLGAGSGGFLGALCVEKEIIIRSDGETFNL